MYVLLQSISLHFVFTFVHAGDVKMVAEQYCSIKEIGICLFVNLSLIGNLVMLRARQRTLFTQSSLQLPSAPHLADSVLVNKPTQRKSGVYLHTFGVPG